MTTATSIRVTVFESQSSSHRAVRARITSFVTQFLVSRAIAADTFVFSAEQTGQQGYNIGIRNTIIFHFRKRFAGSTKTANNSKKNVITASL